jgi:hypothetical protein
MRSSIFADVTPSDDLGAGRAVQARAAVNDACHLDATELAVLIRSKQVSAREVMAAHLARIAGSQTFNAVFGAPCPLGDDGVHFLVDALAPDGPREPTLKRRGAGRAGRPPAPVC